MSVFGKVSIQIFSFFNHFLCIKLSEFLIYFEYFEIGTVSIHMLQMIKETDLGKGVLGLYQDILKTGRTRIFMTGSQALSPN